MKKITATSIPILESSIITTQKSNRRLLAISKRLIYMSWNPSPRLQLKMSVWSLESLLFLLLVSQPHISAAHTEERRFISLGRVPLLQSSPRHSSFSGKQSFSRRRSSSAGSVKNDGLPQQDAPVLLATSVPRAFRQHMGRDTSNTALTQPVSSMTRPTPTSSVCEIGVVSTAVDDTQGANDSSTSPQSTAPESLHPQQPIWIRRFTNARSHFPINFAECLPPFLRPPESKTGGKKVQAELSSEECILSTLATLAEPLIPEHVWHQMTGSEFQDHPELLTSLAVMGEAVARRDDVYGEWIAWHEYGSSTTASKRKTQGNENSLRDGDIHVWTGKCVASADKREANGGQQSQYFGAHLPFIKTRSIIPFAVSEMVDLLLDSTRVQLINPWSLGRRDCWVAVADDTGAVTKIVKNRVQPPLGSKAMVSTTLLHARPAQSNDGTWIVVSRSVGQNGSAHFATPSDDDASAGRSDILLGVNLLQPVSEDSCVLTAVTHVHSSAVPTLLAERLGVQSAIKFVKDMRKLKAAAAAPPTEGEKS